jgi:hypothetical protein
MKKKIEEDLINYQAREGENDSCKNKMMPSLLENTLNLYNAEQYRCLGLRYIHSSGISAEIYVFVSVSLVNINELDSALIFLK